jgi:predicted small secreted protein
LPDDRFGSVLEHSWGLRIEFPVPTEQLRRFKGGKHMVRKVLALALVAGSMMVAACNTVEGAGKDVSSAGEAVSDAAK